MIIKAKNFKIFIYQNSKYVLIILEMHERKPS